MSDNRPDLGDAPSVGMLLAFGGARVTTLGRPEPDAVVIVHLPHDPAEEDAQHLAELGLRIAVRLMCDPRQVIAIGPGATLSTMTGEALRALGLQRIPDGPAA